MSKNVCDVSGTKLTEEVSLPLMRGTLEAFAKLHRYSGSEQGEEAVEYIVKYLEKEGVPCKTLSYDCYRSLPVSASVTVNGVKYDALAAVYSGEAEDLTADLYYDAESEKGKLTDLENEERLKKFKGKIVLTSERTGDFALTAHKAGALGVVVIWPQPEPWLHHMTIGTVWGNPTIHDMYRYCRIPFLGVNRETGLKLKEMCTKEGCKAALNIKMNNGIVKTSMPVITIPGKSEKYVLVSGHYDSWYEGITDNATSNAATLEIARILYEHRNELKRSVKIAFWSGHSDGRYAGSSWYVDNQWEDLNKNCVAHINLDLIGGKNDELVSRGTSLMEKEGLSENIIEEFSGVRPVLTTGLCRAGDESFSGVGVPISMLSGFASKTDGEYALWAKCYAPWWHSVADTLDKVNEDFLMRDTKINLKLVWEILQSDKLPVDMAAFAKRTEAMLVDIQKECTSDFDPQGVIDEIQNLKKALVRLDQAIAEYGIEDTDDIIKKVSGNMVRLHYTYGSQYYHDPAYAGYSDLHIFNMMRGVTRENTSQENYLMYQTDFRRQCNRQVAEMQKIVEMIDMQIMRWKYGC